MSAYIRKRGDRILLKVQVQTRASRDEVVGPHGDSLKVRITAAPVGGAANTQLLKFLAKKLKVTSNQIAIHSGTASRNKWIAIMGISAAEVRERLA